MLLPPLASLVYTRDFPSGENLGLVSKAIPFVILVALPPEIGIIYKSPNKSKTIF